MLFRCIMNHLQMSRTLIIIEIFPGICHLISCTFEKTSALAIKWNNKFSCAEFNLEIKIRSQFCFLPLFWFWLNMPLIPCNGKVGKVCQRFLYRTENITIFLCHLITIKTREAAHTFGEATHTPNIPI